MTPKFRRRIRISNETDIKKTAKLGDCAKRTVFLLFFRRRTITFLPCQLGSTHIHKFCHADTLVFTIWPPLLIPESVTLMFKCFQCNLHPCHTNLYTSIQLVLPCDTSVTQCMNEHLLGSVLRLTTFNSVHLNEMVPQSASGRQYDIPVCAAPQRTEANGQNVTIAAPDFYFESGCRSFSMVCSRCLIVLIAGIQYCRRINMVRKAVQW